MNRRSLLKLAGIGALVPVISKADALRIEQGEEPKDPVEQMPTATGTIRHWNIRCEDWNRYQPMTIEIEIENNAESYEMLRQYIDSHFQVAIVPIVKG